MSSNESQRALESPKITTMEAGTGQFIETLSLSPDLVDPALIPILESRYAEAQRCLSHSPMATIMLCGSLLEGLLIGLANKNPQNFNRSQQSPRDESGKPKPFKDWSLAQLIDVAHNIGVLQLDVKNFGQNLRNFRNYIHPYQQMKEGFDPNRYTAEMSITVVKAAVHNLVGAVKKEKGGFSDEWDNYEYATSLVLVSVVGSWDEKKQADKEAISLILDTKYEDWVKVAREILHLPDSPLSLKDGVWTVSHRKYLLENLGSRILDSNLETFRSQAVSVLKEKDPALELPSQERYAASIYGKAPVFSPAIRSGLAEGLAILGCYPEAYSNCTLGNAEMTAVLGIREIFDGADWMIWGSLNGLLPTLSEAAPQEFLDAVDVALRLSPCPFDELFTQEGDGITGCNYMTGLLRALESIAWEERYLVQVCGLLAQLASRDPGGRWANRPANSLTEILLPWMPHTLAGIEKRKVAVQTVVDEWPDVGWNLLLSLLPNQHQIASGTHKPQWRKIIPDGWEKGVTEHQYWLQSSSYEDLAISTAGRDVAKLSDLVRLFENLNQPAFEKMIESLSSGEIRSLPEDQRQILWRRLSRFTRKHRRYSEAKWSLPDESIKVIEAVAEGLAPTDPLLLYQDLFSGQDFDFYEESESWQERRRKLDERRVSAIGEIIARKGIGGAVSFAETVSSPHDVGVALADISARGIEEALLPDLLDSENEALLGLVRAFVSRRHHSEGWGWCDVLNREKWTKRQMGQFLACLPFCRETWERVLQWLYRHQENYWHRAHAFTYEAKEDLDFAVDRLIEYDRPYAAISCLERMINSEGVVDSSQCVRALLGALKTEEPDHEMNGYNMVQVIKYLQSVDSVGDDELFRVEWAYLPLLNQLDGNKPVFLHRKLANEPDFFCEVIARIYLSDKEVDKVEGPSEEQKAIAKNAYLLLGEWTRPPGLKDDGTFDSESFKAWLQRVKNICAESGHLDAALINIGKVLIYSPADEDGLWINKSVANALSDRNVEEMRNAFTTALYNSRGVHTLDPSGKAEMDLAEKYRMKAEDIENAGCYRLAVSLRGLSENYIRQSNRIKSDFGE